MPRARLITAVSTGNRRESLEAIRGRLAEELQRAEGRDVASLAKELRAVIAELDALPNPLEVDGVVDLRAAIARKQAAAGL